MGALQESLDVSPVVAPRGVLIGLALEHQGAARARAVGPAGHANRHPVRLATRVWTVKWRRHRPKIFGTLAINAGMPDSWTLPQSVAAQR